MGWGTYFNTEIYLNRMSFSRMFELDNAILEVEKDIEQQETQLLMYAASTPVDIIKTEDPGSVLTILSYDVKEILEELSSLYVKQYRLELFKELVGDDEEKLKKYNPFTGEDNNE